MNKYKVYLCGAMEYASNGGTQWRDEVSKKLQSIDIDFFNPAGNEHTLLEDQFGVGSAFEFLGYKKTDPGYFLKCMRAIIAYDMDAIDQLDSILVYITKGLSGGTIGEITHAYRNLGIPVFAVLEEGLQFHEVSGWVLGCITEIFPSFDTAILEIQNHKRKVEQLFSQMEEII